MTRKGIAGLLLVGSVLTQLSVYGFVIAWMFNYQKNESFDVNGNKYTEVVQLSIVPGDSEGFYIKSEFLMENNATLSLGFKDLTYASRYVYCCLYDANGNAIFGENSVTKGFNEYDFDLSNYYNIEEVSKKTLSKAYTTRVGDNKFFLDFYLSTALEDDTADITFTYALTISKL